MIPEQIHINAQRVDQYFRLPLPEATIGDYSISVMPVGELRFMVIKRHGDILRWVIYNAIEDMDPAAFVKLSWSGMLTPPHKLGSQQGYQWVDEDRLDEIHEGITTPWDGWWQGTVEFNSPAIDVPYTGTTGSPYTLHHDPHCVIMRKHGVSPMGARLLSRNVDFQLIRSRHRWSGASIAGADGVPEHKIPGFNYAAANQHGASPYDPGHMTVTRLTDGFRLTGDPIYLYEAVHAICHPFPHAPVLTNPSKAYNAREQAGWPVKAYVDLVSMLLDTGIAEPFQPLIRFLVERSEAAFGASLIQHPLIDPYAKPEIMVDGQKVLYCHSWHYAPVLFAAQRWIEIIDQHGASPVFEQPKTNHLRAVAQVLADKLAAWFNDVLWQPKTKTVAIHVAPTITEYQSLTGTATWFAAGLALRKEPGPLYDAIAEKLMLDYPASKGPAKHQYGLNLIPVAFGF